MFKNIQEGSFLLACYAYKPTLLEVVDFIIEVVYCGLIYHSLLDSFLLLLLCSFFYEMLIQDKFYKNEIQIIKIHIIAYFRFLMQNKNKSWVSSPHG